MIHTGILLNRSDIKTTESGFTSIEFYLDCKTFDQNTGQEYPNKLKFQLIGDRVSLLDQYKRGERISVSFNIKGREYDKQDGTKGHIQNLNVWKIEKVQNFQQQSVQSNTSTSQQSSNSVKEDEDDDLPF